jgi:hypothetical protein
MAGKSQLSIRAAVMNCLARCAESDAPLCCLAEFLEKLGAMGWEPADVAQVQGVVLQILSKLGERHLERRQSVADERTLTGAVATQPTPSSQVL